MKALHTSSSFLPMMSSCQTIPSDFLLCTSSLLIGAKVWLITTKRFVKRHSLYPGNRGSKITFCISLERYKVLLVESFAASLSSWYAILVRLYLCLCSNHWLQIWHSGSLYVSYSPGVCLALLIG